MVAYPQSMKTFSYEESFLKTTKIQEILWTFMPDGFEFEIEIISPVKATVRAVKSCYYVQFVAQALMDSEEPKIRNGDLLLVQFPLKTWERALYAIPLQDKKRWNNLNNDNIYVKAKRIRDSVLRIDKCEKREVTDEQLEFAAEYY